MPKFGRRDFIKLAAAVPAAFAFSRLFPDHSVQQSRRSAGLPNVVFLVFDAMSAYNLSVYGYQRKTTPNLERFARIANVYHAHYSAANFTVPGTSSMLTGLYPWRTRALHLSGLIARDLTGHNIFKLLGGEYHRFAFSQNVWATNLLHQFGSDLDTLLPSSSFSDLSSLTSELFGNDPNNAHQIQDDLLFDFVDPPGSLLFGLAHRLYFERRKKKTFDRDFPRGIPQPRNYPISFKLENVFDGLINALDHLPAPFFSYIHIFSPHAPYRARRDFIGIFDDGWNYPQKPDHVFTEGETYETTEKNRVWYDEYIANVDAEFGRLLDYLEQTGMLDNCCVLVTSDHGELLERGVKGHVTPLLYEPLVRVPLLISTPGQTERQDIYSPTCSVDLLPTLLNLAGREIPDWAEGRLLPGIGGKVDPARPVYMLEAKSSSAFGRLKTATFSMRKEKHKIIMYRGYDVLDGDLFELYDLEEDPLEMTDLFSGQGALAAELKEELLEKFEEINDRMSAGEA